MRGFLNKTSLWTQKWSKSRYGGLVIFLSLFIDASVFPLPTTVIFITVSLIHPLRSNNNALMAVTGMVLGSIIGYTIGHFLWLLPDGNFTNFAMYFFNHIPGFTEANYLSAQNLYIKWGYMILLFSTVIPLPYQILSITAGAFAFNIYAFALATLVFQGIRFFLLAWLIVRYGVGVSVMVKKNLRVIVVTTIILLVIVYLLSLINS